MNANFFPRFFVLLGQVAAIAILLAVVGCNSHLKDGQAAQEFEAARELLIQGQFGLAATQLESFIERRPQHQLASRAHFLRAKCSLGSGDLELARQWFDRTRTQFPSTEEAHKSQFKLALIEVLQGRFEKADQQFRQLAEQADGPNTPESVALSRFLAERVLPDAP